MSLRTNLGARELWLFFPIFSLFGVSPSLNAKGESAALPPLSMVAHGTDPSRATTLEPQPWKKIELFSILPMPLEGELHCKDQPQIHTKHSLGRTWQS